MAQIPNTFTPDSAHHGFTALTSGIEEWVEQWTDKFFNNDEFLESWLKAFRYFSRIAEEFGKLLESHDDLSSAIGYFDSDQEVLQALITRFVLHTVFITHKSCGIPASTVYTLRIIGQQGMPRCTDPKFTEQDIQIWSAQAYYALFAHPSYPEARQANIDALSMDLADILGFFIGPSDEDVFQKSISSKIIEPAIRLFEGFQTATDEYYFETSNWVNPGRRLSGSVPDSQVLGVINSLDCRNVARIMAAFKPTRLRPSPSIANLRKDLFFVCSLRPALVVRYKGEKKNSEIVTQQRVLVAWDPAHLVGGDVTVRKTATWLSAVRDGALKYLSQTTRYD